CCFSASNNPSNSNLSLKSLRKVFVLKGIEFKICICFFDFKSKSPMILTAIPSTSFFDNSSKFSGKNDSNCCFFFPFPLLVDLSIVSVEINPLPKHFLQLLFNPWQIQISDLIYFLLNIF